MWKDNSPRQASLTGTVPFFSTRIVAYFYVTQNKTITDAAVPRLCARRGTASSVGAGYPIPGRRSQELKLPASVDGLSDLCSWVNRRKKPRKNSEACYNGNNRCATKPCAAAAPASPRCQSAAPAHGRQRMAAARPPRQYAVPARGSHKNYQKL